MTSIVGVAVNVTGVPEQLGFEPLVIAMATDVLCLIVTALLVVEQPLGVDTIAV